MNEKIEKALGVLGETCKYLDPEGPSRKALAAIREALEDCAITKTQLKEAMGKPPSGDFFLNFFGKTLEDFLKGDPR